MPHVISNLPNVHIQFQHDGHTGSDYRYLHVQVGRVVHWCSDLLGGGFGSAFFQPPGSWVPLQSSTKRTADPYTQLCKCQSPKSDIECETLSLDKGSSKKKPHVTTFLGLLHRILGFHLNMLILFPRVCNEAYSIRAMFWLVPAFEYMASPKLLAPDSKT